MGALGRTKPSQPGLNHKLRTLTRPSSCRGHGGRRPREGSATCHAALVGAEDTVLCVRWHNSQQAICSADPDDPRSSGKAAPGSDSPLLDTPAHHQKLAASLRSLRGTMIHRDLLLLLHVTKYSLLKNCFEKQRAAVETSEGPYADPHSALHSGRRGSPRTPLLT